ncbi:hypothetical protein [Mycobacterium sp.]|nr:hypothetical protein [Mycobacterium sp.]HKP39980.1 hypothetical protein [Mycobacterium sp.]
MSAPAAFAEPTIAPPEAVGRICIALAVFGTVEVPLHSPLADRQVLSIE